MDQRPFELALEEPLNRASDRIFNHFASQGTRVYRQRELDKILRDHLSAWNLPLSMTGKYFRTFLQGKLLLKELVLTSRQYGNKRRFIWANATPLEVALSIRPGSYLSHGTAAFLHNLTEQIPKTIYANKEQTKKTQNRETTVTQERLDFAFKRPQRSSNYVYTWDKYKFVLLNGKHTDNLEVSEIEGTRDEGIGLVRATRLERTLIDIVVRPAYAGGVYSVLDMYKEARNKAVSTSVMIATLKRLDHAYPYHQAIGFLMQKAGFNEDSWQRIRKLGLSVDFYLTYGMKQLEYNQAWRLWIPKGF